MIIDNTITREDFEKSCFLKGFEVFTEQEIKSWMNDNKKLIEKSEVQELEEDEKKYLENFKIDAKSFNKAIVIENDLSKSIMFYRESQIKRDDNGKCTIHTYKDTIVNREKGLVGKSYETGKV